MSDQAPQKPQPPRPIDNAHMGHLIEERAGHIKIREAEDAKAKKLNDQLMEMMVGAGLERHQLPNGTIVSITRQPDRASIVAERLVGHGVGPNIIADSTKFTPVAPFIRVDAPKAPAGAEVPTTAGNVDQIGTLTDQRPN